MFCSESAVFCQNCKGMLYFTHSALVWVFFVVSVWNHQALYLQKSSFQPVQFSSHLSPSPLNYCSASETHLLLLTSFTFKPPPLSLNLILCISNHWCTTTALSSPGKFWIYLKCLSKLFLNIFLSAVGLSRSLCTSLSHLLHLAINLITIMECFILHCNMFSKSEMYHLNVTL